ncbi:hypothetical protein [Nitrosomonas eutropha]|uniref:Uncharacterized protein n=2 Tax=Nitrosomonadaceae TaxID=206379 RepID=A0ABX5M778_9PROT|nr:hypothetical protein [Nitrosomonas eutropha]PXV81575.1 hypothetical protein C8R14_11117 [Nitrosomonas eutropha]SCX25308.1 hypothetical protein SAMN05216379_1275 [Nitrosomonas eutropha]SDX12010.1 hypothetical protein SAMN05216317_1362 [Nitrosomonas eutropha]
MVVDRSKAAFQRQIKSDAVVEQLALNCQIGALCIECTAVTVQQCQDLNKSLPIGIQR